MILSVNANHPEPRKISLITEALRDGEVIAYPTDTVFGLGCDVMNKKAVEKLRQLKRLSENHPLTFICPDLAEIAKYASVTDAQYRFLKLIFPGPYCAVLSASREIPKLIQSKKKTVGIRIPDHPVCKALATSLGTPLTSTTAQTPGSDFPEIDPHEIQKKFPSLAFVIDSGQTGLEPSTMLDLTTNPFTLLREGAGPVDHLLS